jgi:tRNA pseudouridine38-40 synthase
MYRYQILIEYVGTSYVGWQIQKKGKSVQKTIQSILSKLLKQKIILYSAGRTDGQVHAKGQSAHFDIENKIQNINKMVKSLNFFLNPKKISIINIIKRNKNFHARYSAKERIYKYFIINRLATSVIENERVWHIRKKLDIKLLKEGAKKLVGTHDFSTMRATNCYAKSPIKKINKITIKNVDRKIEIEFRSKSFLRNQVRSMVGCLKYLAENRWDIKKFENVLKSKKRNNCAPPAPACGLYLEKIIY